MKSEISLLTSGFSGYPWNSETQEEYMTKLLNDPNFMSTGVSKDLAFSARDRINRGPKSLGFVDIKPTIKITPAGKNFLDTDLTEESLLRQMLKFQLPSPFHKESSNITNTYLVKPYLEIFRLIYTLKEISFDELMIFGMQLTKYSKFEEIINKIKKFRKKRSENSGNYNLFFGEYRFREIEEIYHNELNSGKTATRESNDVSRENFIKTKARNLRDYTDACFRYLRATGLVAISQKSKKLSITPDKKEEVKFFLNTIDRKPVFVNDETMYKKYLYNASCPVLYSDDRHNLENEVTNLTSLSHTDASKLDSCDLKKLLKKALLDNKMTLINKQIRQIKEGKDYLDIIAVFSEIKKNNYYDLPLMLEWNTWRAMTFLDGGNVNANLNFDDSGQPMSTASGNMADIVCDYGDFYIIVEVTMQTGQRQYEMEGEPVSRHLGDIKKKTGKQAYCFFIAPKINNSCIAHFYTLHLTNIAYYCGVSIILPLELSVFEKMLQQSREYNFAPNPQQLKSLCDYSLDSAKKAKDEMEWYQAVRTRALEWLNV